MPYITSIERFGREEGMQLGLEKGMEKGMEKGIEKGIEKGMEKGQLMTCRENILELLEARFGGAPYKIRERLSTETDLARLKGWLRLAGTCAKLEDFNLC
jgi:hypothetical protein